MGTFGCQGRETWTRVELTFTKKKKKVSPNVSRVLDSRRAIGGCRHGDLCATISSLNKVSWRQVKAAVLSGGFYAAVNASAAQQPFRSQQACSASWLLHSNHLTWARRETVGRTPEVCRHYCNNTILLITLLKRNHSAGCSKSDLWNYKDRC